MSGTSAIMNTALMGLLTYQSAIGITSENIANVDTEGYSRRTVAISGTGGISSNGSVVASGVQSAEATRVVDRFVLANVVASATEMGRLETETNYLSYVEALFDESEGAGLEEALSDFWSAWQDLVSDPSGDEERTVLASNAASMADMFNQIAEGLNDTRQEIDLKVASAVEEINQTTAQIAELNENLVEYQSSGRNTDSIEDSLDYLTERLATLTNVNTYRNDSGQVCAQLSNGKPLVDGTSSWDLEAELDAGTGLYNVVWNDGYGTTTTVNDAITGGVLGGSLSVRDETIPSYLDDLNELAATLITEVNALLNTGYDLDGNAGVDMFTGTNAEDIAVNQDIIDNPGLIAAAADAASVPGDGSIAEAIADLQNENLMSGGSSTPGEFYSALVSRVGGDVSSAESEYEYQTDLDEFYRNFQESVSGVSLDEESASLVLYQQAYEASARVITLLRELFETMLEM